MTHNNIEIKARTTNPAKIRAWLLDNGADFKGTDHQTDTYFNTNTGRLKLREGNIENNLIFYHRANQSGPKHSRFLLLPVADPALMKTMLTEAYGVKIIVEKLREIYYIGNIKFHIDNVPQLGNFVEIEAGDVQHEVPIDTLRKQCDFYMQSLDIHPTDLVDVSYSDMLLNR